MQGLLKFIRGFGFWLFLIAGVTLWLTQPIVILILALPLILWLLIDRRGRQALMITWTGISTLPQRLGSTSVIILGIAGVVGVLVALLSMAEGMQATLKQAGDDNTAIILRAGANAELNSGIDRQSATLIKQVKGVLHNADDKPVASAESVIIANIPKKATATDSNVRIRGVEIEAAQAIRSNIKIIEGRFFKTGLQEVIVGKGAEKEFMGLNTAATIDLNNQTWTVVGIFETGDAHESEIWADIETLNAASRRTGFQSVYLRLIDPSAFEQVKTSLTSDPRLKVDVETTRSYYTKQSENTTRNIRIIGTVVAVIMAIGAAFGALNTMYSAVAVRAREIATLRALGFTNLPVVIAILIETMLLASLGGLIGAGIAYSLFNGYSASTLGANFSQVVFAFQVTPQLLMSGLQWAFAIGLIGGLFPALHAAKLPITVALKEQ